ncbi:DUF2061 domain-containing protein [Candidatus Kaiserbacteria bacterium]|nr:DUF2061 domain-containing protein [Candidatus Kaiserbacteria bacterium]
MQTETHARTLVKTVVWRIIATLISISVVYSFTGAMKESVEISLAGAAIGVVTYYLHERFWNAVQWGRVEK